MINDRDYTTRNSLSVRIKPPFCGV